MFDDLDNYDGEIILPEFTVLLESFRNEIFYTSFMDRQIKVFYRW